MLSFKEFFNSKKVFRNVEIRLLLYIVLPPSSRSFPFFFLPPSAYIFCVCVPPPPRLVCTCTEEEEEEEGVYVCHSEKRPRCACCALPQRGEKPPHTYIMRGVQFRKGARRRRRNMESKIMLLSPLLLLLLLQQQQAQGKPAPEKEEEQVSF